MAIFNPDPQPGSGDMPNFFKYSEPIKDLTVDKSTGLALATTGTALEEGANLAKNTAQEWIKEDTKNTIEPIRKDFTDTLMAARAGVVPAPVQTDEGSTAGPLSLAPDGIKATIPSAVLRGLDKLSATKASFDQGRVNDTWYHMRLDEALTGLRSKYPGFVDYIDKEGASILESSKPANQVIKDLMEDINHAQTGKKDEHDKLLDLARGAATKGLGGYIDPTTGKPQGLDKASQMYERLKADPSFGPRWMQWYAEENAKDTALSRDTVALQNQNLHGDDAVKSWKANLGDFVSRKVTGDLNATEKLTGMDKPESFMSFLQKINANPGSYKAEQIEDLATRMQMHRNIMGSQLRAEIAQLPQYRNVPASDVDAIVDSKLKVYDDMYTALKGGGPTGAAAAYYHANQVNGMMNQTKFDLAQGKEGEYRRNFEVLRTQLGDIITNEKIIPEFNKSQALLPENMRRLFGVDMSAAIGQPNGPAKPTVVTDQMRKIDANEKISPEDKAKSYQEYLRRANEFIKGKDLDDASKANLVKYLFNPKNNAMLDFFKEDTTEYTAPRGGILNSNVGGTSVFKPGKQTVFQMLTDKNATDVISKLDPESRQMYRNWVDITSRELIGQNVRDLKNLSGHDNLAFEWHNDGNGRLYITAIDKDEKQNNQSTNPAINSMRPAWRVYTDNVVSKINKILPNLDYVYKKEGGNTEAMILQTLQQHGMDFNGDIRGLPKSLGDAIAASRKPQEKPKDDK